MPNVLKAIDFFCGAGGMSFGLQQAGVKILGGVDIDHASGQTYAANLKGARFMQRDISQLQPSELIEVFNLKRQDPDLLFCGCSPCQFWSKVSTDRSRSFHTAFLLEHFQRLIAWFQPGMVMIENVPGLKIKKSESLLSSFHTFLKKEGYAFTDGIVDASHYGVPQHRKRYVMVAVKGKGRALTLPQPSSNTEMTVRRYIGPEAGLVPIQAGERDGSDPLHYAAQLSPTNLTRLRMTPPDGGDRSSWRNDSHLQLQAYRDKDHMFRNVYSRMFWDPGSSHHYNALQ